MIMAHDAASGEIVEERDFVLADWTKTQDVGLVGQLDCGTRSFDYRPYNDDGTIIAHHGGVKIHKTMESSLSEITDWNSKNPEDLVVLYISHFDGDDGGEEAVTSLLDSYKVPYVKDCSQLNTVTYSEAQTMGTRSTGGSLIAIFECTEEYYDENINCYGKDFTWYDSWPENTTAIPWADLNNYIAKTTSSDPTVSSPNMWMTQAHWQSSAASISLGTLHRSSIVKDEKLSGVNVAMEKQILAGQMKYLNFLELDNVCDNGLEVYKAIKSYYLS